VASDGKGKSLWAPRQEGQVLAVERAYPDATDIGRIEYIEAHATSTQVGDATELGALSGLMAKHLPAGRQIPIGSVKANIVGNQPGRTDGNPAGAALSTADQCLQVQKCYEADLWSDSSNAFCQQLVKGVPLQWDYAFSRGYPYYNCYRYEVANKDQFQTAMNTRYGTSGCRFRVVRVASV
jgi:hypothetical protein